MTEFRETDLSGSLFEHVRLTGSRFRDVYLDRLDLRDVDVSGLRIRAAIMADVDIHAEIDRFVLNGVDVAPYVQAELDRRHPGRALMRPTDADGFREAWELLERLWSETVARARALPEERLHERVDGEWSFIETLRHLAFATDAWINRVLLGDPSPWDPLDLPFDEMQPIEGVPWDREARPSLEEALRLRADRQATMRRVLADLTDERLAEETEPIPQPGYPESIGFPVDEVLRCVLNEEWEHRLYAERDLAALHER